MMKISMELQLCLTQLKAESPDAMEVLWRQDKVCIVAAAHLRSSTP